VKHSATRSTLEVPFDAVTASVRCSLIVWLGHGWVKVVDKSYIERQILIAAFSKKKLVHIRMRSYLDSRISVPRIHFVIPQLAIDGDGRRRECIHCAYLAVGG
jgi:hypothetical protein